MLQDIQYDPLTGEIVAVVNYSSAPEKWPDHPSRVIVEDKREFVPLADLAGFKVDRADPLALRVRAKTAEEKLVDALKAQEADSRSAEAK